MKDVPWFPFGLICGFYGVLGLFVLAGFVAQIWAVIDCAKRRFKDDATKILWILVILFLHLVGVIVYSIVGRPMGTLPEEYR